MRQRQKDYEFKASLSYTFYRAPIAQFWLALTLTGVTIRLMTKPGLVTEERKETDAFWGCALSNNA